MAEQSKRRIGRWVGLAVVAAGAVLVVTWSRWPADIEVTHPRRGEIRASFREPARTRLEKTYPITMPVAGRIGRVDLEPGDRVTVGQVLVQFDRVPFEQAAQEARAAVAELEASLVVKRDSGIENTGLDQSRSMVSAAAEAVNAAKSQVEAEQARADRAAKELKRMESLAAGQAISEALLDDTRLAAETSVIALREKEFNQAAIKAMFVVTDLMPKLIEQYIGRKVLEEQVLVHQLAQARARLVQAEHDLDLAQIVSPIAGVVLERDEQGSRTLPAGQPLLLVGDLEQLEVIADVLTEDALRIGPGSLVSLEPAAGRGPLTGEVKRIEPAGFTKLSSLGVEQQRVNVIVAFDREPRDLGVGYRLQARFFTGAKTDALILPRFSVMQSPDGRYYVLKVEGGMLRKQVVTIGLTSDADIEIGAGLSESDLVVNVPDATLKEGQRVSPVTVAPPSP